MRSRIAIKSETLKAPLRRNEILILEVLLDIRELLQNPPREIVGVSDEALDAALAGLPPEKDELFDEAVTAVRQKTGGHIQARWLAAMFGISYGRASALIDQLQAAGVISPKDGAKPRKVL